jgi:Xaa-Pro aminopeptidase
MRSYVTGAEDLHDAHVLVSVESGATQLFHSVLSADDQVWVGPQPSNADLAAYYDVTAVYAYFGQSIMIIRRDVKELKDAVGLFSTVLTLPNVDLAHLGIGDGVKVDTKVLGQCLRSARMHKTAYEVAVMRAACDKSSRAHESLMRHTAHLHRQSQLVSEQQCAAHWFASVMTNG